MTEIPEHLLKRAEAAGVNPALPGEPFDPPLTPEERERIAVALVNMREGSDKIIEDLLANAKAASESAKAAHTELTRRHRAALVVAVLGTALVCVLLGVVIAMIAVNAS